MRISFSRRILAALVLGSVIGVAGPARADLVVNGDFGTGDFTGWTLSGDTSYGPYAYVATMGTGIGGANSAALSTFDAGNGSLSQDLTTVVGQSYSFSFLFGGDGVTPNSFSASLGTSTLLSLSDVPGPITSPTTYTFSYTATSTTTALTFQFSDVPGYLYVTDVSVSPNQAVVPEPSTAFAVGLGALAMMGYAWRKHRASTKDRGARAEDEADEARVATG